MIYKLEFVQKTYITCVYAFCQFQNLALWTLYLLLFSRVFSTMVNTKVRESHKQEILEFVKDNFRVLYLDLPPTKSYLKTQKWEELRKFTKG